MRAYGLGLTPVKKRLPGRCRPDFGNFGTEWVCGTVIRHARRNLLGGME